MQFEYKHLLKQLVKADLKVKYKGSFLGVFWSLLEPLSKFIVMFFVFSFIFKSDIMFYPLFLFAGIVVWNFFSNASMGNVNRVVANSNLIKKVNFPRELLVISGVLSSSINFLLELVPVFVLMIVYNVLSFNLFFFIPFFLVFFLLNLGVGFFLSSTNVFMRDVQYIWSVLLQVGFFATPIFYELGSFPVVAQQVITLNPVTGLLNFFRETVIYGSNFPFISFSYSLVFSIVIFIVGYLVFRHFKGRFAEVV